MADDPITCAGCQKEVTQKLACPKCMQLGLTKTFFCGQECFKENYASHKQVHAVAKQLLAAK
jgi:methionyl aminopeptidase